MTRTEHLLTVLMEEAAEVSKECAELSIRTAKALRFGPLEVQDGQEFTNLHRMQVFLAKMLTELTEMLAVAEMAGVLPDSTATGLIVSPIATLKKERVEKYLELSRKCGTLTDDLPAQCAMCRGSGNVDSTELCTWCEGRLIVSGRVCTFCRNGRAVCKIQCPSCGGTGVPPSKE